jgi:hypothetical protein
LKTTSAIQALALLTAGFVKPVVSEVMRGEEAARALISGCRRLPPLHDDSPYCAAAFEQAVQ